MKQTAVEWLVEQVNTSNLGLTSEGQALLVEQAKQMEKEQIIKCFIDVSVESCKTLNFKVTLKDRIDFQNIAEIYYNETFKSE